MVTTVRQALQRVADGKVSEEDPIDVKVSELICVALFSTANSPDARVKGSMRNATRAQRIILDRLVGRRRAGTSPVAARNNSLTFVDLTQGLGAEDDG